LPSKPPAISGDIDPKSRKKIKDRSLIMMQALEYFSYYHNTFRPTYSSHLAKLGSL
jgi:hypothetical protein